MIGPSDHVHCMWMRKIVNAKRWIGKICKGRKTVRGFDGRKLPIAGHNN